jgi:hypothetical protein
VEGKAESTGNDLSYGLILRLTQNIIFQDLCEIGGFHSHEDLDCGLWSSGL